MNDTNLPTVATMALTALVLAHAPVFAFSTMALLNLSTPEPTIIQVQATPAPTRVVIETCTKTGTLTEPAGPSVDSSLRWLAAHEQRLRALEDQLIDPYNGPLCDLDSVECDVEPEQISPESE